MQNYTPATEIDASLSSHLPITWQVQIIDIPRPDYTGLKLNIQEAQTTGDPRLRKIFRLDVDYKESPASPKENSKATSVPRIDPRRKKMEENVKSAEQTVLSYAQQMAMLQRSSFYQNLTSNQKVTLNHELSVKDPVTGNPNEQMLNGILSTLGLLPGQPSNLSNINSNVLSLLSSLTKPGIVHGMGLGTQNPAQGILTSNPGMVSNMNLGMNPNVLGQNQNLVSQMAQSIVQPGLLGAAPGIPNLNATDFQINFDPRNGGLLGNAPPFINYQQDNANFGYEDGNNFNGHRNGNSGNRGGFNNRDRMQRRGGRNFSNRAMRNSSFRNRNRNNRGHTPPP